MYNIVQLKMTDESILTDRRLATTGCLQTQTSITFSQLRGTLKLQFSLCQIKKLKHLTKYPWVFGYMAHPNIQSFLLKDNKPSILVQ